MKKFHEIISETKYFGHYSFGDRPSRYPKYDKTNHPYMKMKEKQSGEFQIKTLPNHKMYGVFDNNYFQFAGKHPGGLSHTIIKPNINKHGKMNFPLSKIERNVITQNPHLNRDHWDSITIAIKNDLDNKYNPLT